MTTQNAGKVEPVAGIGKFRVTSPAAKRPVDPQELEKFAAGAETHPAAPLVPAALVAPNPVPNTAPVVKNKTAERTCALPLRLKPQQFERIEEVFLKSTYKSKQDMGETLLMDAVENLAKQLGM